MISYALSFLAGQASREACSRRIGRGELDSSLLQSKGIEASARDNGWEYSLDVPYSLANNLRRFWPFSGEMVGRQFNLVTIRFPGEIFRVFEIVNWFYADSEVWRTLVVAEVEGSLPSFVARSSGHSTGYVIEQSDDQLCDPEFFARMRALFETAPAAVWQAGGQYALAVFPGRLRTGHIERLLETGCGFVELLQESACSASLNRV